MRNSVYFLVTPIISELKSMRFSKLLRYMAEGSIWTIIVAGALVTVAVMLYESSEPGGRIRRDLTGRVVDKRVSVYESQEGSSFANHLVIEEKSGRRFLLSVTDEMYSRAKVGMWIKRSKNKLELLTDAEQKELSP